MTIYELRDLAILIVVTGTSAIILSLLFAKYRAHWSRRRAALISALPIPAIVWSLCSIVFVRSASASKEDCGVDACGMAMMAAIAVSAYAVFAYGIGIAAAWFARRLVDQ